MGPFKTKRQVGLYIDAGMVCAVGVESGVQGPKVTGCAEMAGENILLAVPDPMQPSDPLGHKIRKVLDSAGIRERTVSLSVPADSSIIRRFEMPMLSKKEEKNAVRFEAQKFVPFDMKDLYYDYEVYPDTAQKKNSIVFFACKKQWVDPLAGLLQSLGIKLDRVELVSQSLSRALHRGSAKTTGQVEAMIIPSDDQAAEMIFFKDDSVLLTRHLSLSQQPGMAAMDVPFFVSEVRISMDYFFENFKGDKIEKLHLITGAGESSRTLAETLAQELSIPVENSDFLKSLGNDQPASSAMATSYGIALGGLLPKNRKKINLRSSETLAAAPALSWEDEKKQLQDMAVKEIIGIAVVLFVAYLFLGNIVSSKNAELNKLLESYPKSQGASIKDSLLELQTKTSQIVEKVGFASSLIDRRPYLTVKMDELVKTVPSHIRLTNLRYEDNINEQGGSVLLMHLEGFLLPTGETGSELSFINKFVKQLSANKEFMQGFDEIKISSTKKFPFKDGTSMMFNLDCVSSKKGGANAP